MLFNVAADAVSMRSALSDPAWISLYSCMRLSMSLARSFKPENRLSARSRVSLNRRHRGIILFRMLCRSLDVRR